MGKQIKNEETNAEDRRGLPGYPHYPKKEDIYESGNKVPLDDKNDSGDSDIDLDVPGSELDDKNEVIGEEDEENNYYSLGGDQHTDLEENSGD